MRADTRPGAIAWSPLLVARRFAPSPVPEYIPAVLQPASTFRGRLPRPFAALVRAHALAFGGSR